MSNNHQDTGNSNSSLLAFYHRKRKEYPKGVAPKLQKDKHLLLQFKDPITGKRTTKGCNVEFTETGIILAVRKAHKIAEKLQTVVKASDFWEWYDREILEKHYIKNDLKTYRVIFQQIENEYFNGYNKNTKRKRSKDIPNDVHAFSGYYQSVFNRFESLDTYPCWNDFKSVLFTWKQGTKSFTDAHSVLTKIAKYCHNKDELLEQLDSIERRQTEFRDKQSISLKEFLEWHDKVKSELPSIMTERVREARESWLWVASMCVIYGLRPSEVAASLNLTQSVTVDKVIIPALSNPNNKDLLLYLGDFTFFGTTIKTGKRLCKPVNTNREMIDRLGIRNPLLPTYSPSDDSTPQSIVSGFDNQFRHRLKSAKCPVSQLYAFRHLYNQLGEMYGIPQEIRARSMGHSTIVNETVYKKRSNVQTTIDLLTNSSKQPMSLEMAKESLMNKGIELSNETVKNVLMVVYQLDNLTELF
ncbi:MAG: hypothetical protein AB4058_14785 [Microcystaceae cyanobacterium]